ncbi:centrosomal protein of 192 kDa isoform X9 [Phyllopteryx taeniolatus]|uniref:centrosomal protein of 192 kDa isoform X9 n=1 Tax=Phyllopteryx taeniolatus TaxID=161469 RepID=UPI002AD28325|nr:centrosomal protein of 192 kDa isoform X9 [Phyllopteryx taeniolatus]
MAESFYKLEDEAFPSFLGRSLDSTNGRATLGNVTLGSGPGLPVAASTVAKMRPQSDNRDGGDASYLEESELEHANSQLSEDKQAKFALSFKDDLDNADDFIAAHRLSEMLIKINLDESASRNQGSLLGLLPTQMGSVQGRHTEHPTDLPTGLLTFAQYGHKDCTNKKVPSLQATTDNNNVPSEAADSDHFSGSSSFLENEKLMSVDSMNSDITDDEIELNNLPDDELELYFRKLVPSAMQRGTVEGQELPATVLPRTSDDRSNSSSIEPEQYGHQIIDDYDQDNFQMPVVRLAATGMDSCPASDEDTEDELESARQTSNSTKNKLLPSISRQLVGESNHPSFRPGLEGGSSDDEWSSGLGGPSLSGIEHRRSAEGRVINPPVTGDGGGGDGSSGSEESGNDRGVSTIPIPTTNVPTTYDVLRGLGIVGSSAVGEDGDGGACSNLTGHGRNNCCTHAEMGDRVGPVGNGEASTSKTSSGGSHTLSPVNWSMIMDRQEALDAMENTESRMTSERAGSAYVKSETGLGRSLQEKSNFSQLQVTQDNFHNSKVPPSSNLRGGPCGNTSAAEASDVTSEEDNDYLSTSLEPKYFCQGVAEEQDHEWNTCPDSVELEFQKGANAPHSVVYQNEEGQWVTDLAYYSSFEKEVDEKATQNDGQFQTEDFVSAGDAFEKIVKDQEEFEKEHQFMQEEQIVPDSSNSAFQNDSWKAGTSSHILMRASQVSSEFNPGDQSYLRLSLGQFFEQRSEALGCLGSGNNVDAIKRPSFGYIITSPEKREPFALIQPSDFPNEESFPHSDSMEVSETDKTLSPDDLDKTFVVSGERVSPKGNTEPGLCEQKDHNSLEALLDCNMGPGSASNMWNQSGVSPQNNSSNLMLSISTIASAIADASISTDPSQLAAMIMELSKKSRARNRTEPAQPTGPEKFVVEPHPDEHKMSSTVQQQGVRQSNSPGKKTPTKILMAVPLSHCSVEKHVGFSFQNTPGDCASALPTESCGEERHCDFRPSTSPLTHSSPSQTSPPEANSTGSPSAASGILAGKCPGHDLSPQSTCSSPSLSRLTYISMNDATVVPTPGRQKSDCTMALSTTIIRFSPTPPMEQGPQSNENICSHSKSLDEVQSKHSKSLEQLPAQHCKNQDTTCGGSNLTCTRSQSECSYAGDKIDGLSANCRNCKNTTESDVKHLTKVDSGYISNSHIPQSVTTAAPHTSEQWGSASSIPSLFSGGLGIPQSYSSEGLHYRPIKFKTPHPGLIDIPHQGDMESLLAGPLVNSQLAQQFFGPNAPLNPGIYHMGATGTGLYSVPSSDVANGDPRVRHIHPTAQPLGIASATGSHHLSRSTQSHQDMGVLGKLYNQYGGEPMVTSCLDELRVQVVVPEELQFPHACCVGIASQTSLSIFNPSERWQQVSITVTSLSIDGEKVVNLPYQWLIVKSKTIIGPKSTEEQKVLFIPPKAGVYQCVLSVCSWPTPTNREVADRASIFARRVVLVAIAENPSVEVEVGNSGCLDFGDLPGGSSKSLLLKLLNMTRATVPIRLVISAKATAWRCFTLSKQQVSVTSEATQPAGHMASLSTSVVNHVMHANYGENPECFMVWVHFKALQKYTTSSGDLGPAEDYSARVDIEVDSPGASHVIKSIPIRARSGTVRVHAPKDLQTVCLRAPLGKSCQTTLPLKNAGNIDVWMKLKCNEDCFSVKPDELFLTVGEEQGIVVSFKPRGSKKYKASLLTILVLPSGPQYEVKLNGEVVSEESVTSAAPVLSSCLGSDVPPILSNKQFVAWGGVTLGRAVQQKLVLRNNSSNATQQLRLLIRGQDQDCFQLQSLFSPEERLTRHGELSIRPQEDVTIHLLFAPTRVACMLAKLEIKQSAVRPSQPGVKFTIPLSGYGGTSNIILEDQRKQADGYVVTVSDIAINHVSKVCLCVRNTGSRAAFIKAVAFSDVMTRSVMDPFVISLAPSQFVLKERTQEAITVLMKSTQREQTLCQSDTPLLATVVLFCGDEVSRQQYRRLLQSKPDAGQKVLAENSLLKIIDFNDKFLGEEITTEPFDLPQRPNEAYIFYGHVGKVAVSLLGSTYSKEYEQSDSPEMMLTSAIQDLVTESGMVNGNVSLDVLPVKGPQGPAIRVTGCSLKTSEPALRHSGSWTVHPEQLVLGAPTMNAVASTNQVQIKNNTSRELSFDLSWPAHYLTITPQHGVIEPQCHLQILISPNPSLASKSDMLPWNGTIYVLCDGQQKLIKVQIRQDLVLDVSAAPGDVTLSALPPQAATPVLPAVRITSKSTLPLSPLQLPQALVEIPNKNIIFSDTPSGETSETHLDVENGEMDVRWYISSFAPPYVKGVDNSCDVYRATYTAFRCSRVSGTLGAHEKMQVPITFLPRDRGDYAQFWDLECHPLSEPLQKYRIRFQLCGTGINSGPIEGLQEGDCSLVKTETTIKTRKKAEVSTSKTSVNQEEAEWRGVYTPQDVYTFPDTRIGEFSSLKVNIRNNSPNTHEIPTLSETACSVQAEHCRQTRWLAAHPVRNKWKSGCAADWTFLSVNTFLTGNVKTALGHLRAPVKNPPSWLYSHKL